MRYNNQNLNQINNSIFGVFFREKPAMMLIELKNNNGSIYASTLAKSVDCTYSHVVKILQEMERAKLIEFDKRGRLKIIRLTNRGQEIANSVEAIRHVLHNGQN